MRSLLILILAALLEVGGDALLRAGIHGRGPAVLGLGAVVLFLYGLTVNQPDWSFGRLLGVYIAVFYIVSQLVARFAFGERIAPVQWLAGAMIAGAGLLLTLWPSSR